jgi:hypothetical protein
MPYFSAPPTPAWKTKLAKAVKEYGPTVALSIVFGPAGTAIGLALKAKADRKRKTKQAQAQRRAHPQAMPKKPAPTGPASMKRGVR